MYFNLDIAAALMGTASYIVGDTSSKFVSEFFGNRTASITSRSIVNLLKSLSFAGR